MREKWTPEDDEFLRTNYSSKTSTEIASLLGRTRSAVKNRTHSIGLKLSVDDLTPERRKCFAKGSIPVNKGKKMPEHVYEKAKATMFKKGNIPHNTKPVGYTRITKDGYVMIKRSGSSKFELLHRIVYQECIGDIPEGYNVQFKDKDRKNCDPENLYLIDRKNQVLQNTIHRYPDEIKELIRLQGKLKRVIKKYNQNGKK